MGPGEKGRECVSPTPALHLLPAWETTATQEGAVPAYEVTPGQGDGSPSSEKFAFLFLSSQMARPLSTPSPSQMQARKKRRGIIEKRRRDRINSSLSELRRLVPTAFEKQVCAIADCARGNLLECQMRFMSHGIPY